MSHFASFAQMESIRSFRANPSAKYAQLATRRTAARRIHQDAAIAPVRSTKRKRSRQLVLHANQANIKFVRSRHSVKLVVLGSTRLPLQVLDVSLVRLAISVQQPPFAVRRASPGRIKTKREVHCAFAVLLAICRVKQQASAVLCARQANLTARRGQQIVCAAIRDMQARPARRSAGRALLEHSAMNAPSGCSMKNLPRPLKRIRWF